MKTIALVTGASRGIGAAITRSFAEAGSIVLAVARNGVPLESLRRKKDLGLVESFSCDVSSPEDVGRMRQEIEKRYAHIDVLVNNAGAGFFEPIMETSLEHWHVTLNTNVTGIFLMTQAFVPMLKRSKQAHIFTICSGASRKGFPNCGAYAASKFGALGFTEVLREEMRSHKIKVTAILPGAVDTPFWETQNSAFDRTQMLSAEDVAGAVHYAYGQAENNCVEEIVLKPSRGDF
jgi:NAD(P)-dependent dehydrogenase (short-subunit alcohol dehydrogenase family)